jgi:hypothetical protein
MPACGRLLASFRPPSYPSGCFRRSETDQINLPRAAGDKLFADRKIAGPLQPIQEIPGQKGKMYIVRFDVDLEAPKASRRGTE